MSGSQEHESLIKTPKQLIVTVILSFLVPIFGIVLLVKYVTQQPVAGAGSEAQKAEAVLERIRPIAQVELKDALAPKVARSGEEIYKAVCAACHQAGVAGAPKFGDKTAWASHISHGLEHLAQNAINGIRGMPARGGADLDDNEVTAAVVYMANAAGANFKLPEPKASAAVDPKAEAKPVASNDAAPSQTQQMVAVTTEPSKPVPAVTPVAASRGEGLYKQACSVCHAAGIAGAPKFGDKSAWSPRLPAGVDGLTQSVIKGKGAMPAKGGAAQASDADIKAAVEYMVQAVK